MTKMHLVDYYVASKREELEIEILRSGCNKHTFNRLYNLTFSSITKSEPFYSSFNCEELLDAVFGASVILCGTKAKVLSTEIEGKKQISENKNALEFLLFSIIAVFAENSDTSFYINAEIKDELKVKFVSDKQIIINNILNPILKRLDAKITVFNEKNTTLILSKKLNGVGKKPNTVLKDYEYIMDPYSVAYVCLRNVSINPVLNNTLCNFNTINSR